jgi:hypothetical protein
MRLSIIFVGMLISIAIHPTNDIPIHEEIVGLGTIIVLLALVGDIKDLLK